MLYDVRKHYSSLIRQLTSSVNPVFSQCERVAFGQMRSQGLHRVIVEKQRTHRRDFPQMHN